MNLSEAVTYQAGGVGKVKTEQQFIMSYMKATRCFGFLNTQSSEPLYSRGSNLSLRHVRLFLYGKRVIDMAA